MLFRSQRTAAALAAIAARDWSGAAAQMLDYYDRCYDHELSRGGIHHLGSVDLGDRDDEAAALWVLRHGLAPDPA